MKRVTPVEKPRTFVPSKHSVQHWVFTTPVGDFDRLIGTGGAMKAVKESLGSYQDEDGNSHIVAKLSDRPVNQFVSRRR